MINCQLCGRPTDSPHIITVKTDGEKHEKKLCSVCYNMRASYLEYLKVRKKEKEN